MHVVDSILIAANPALVWQVTVDVERWPDWTPTVTSVKRRDDGPFRAGSVARIKQPAQPEGDWTVTEFLPGRRFAWETRRPGIRLVGTHELSPEGGGTRNTLGVDARGPLAVLLWPVLRLAIRRALSAENRGLKKHCETLSRVPSNPPHSPSR